MARDTTQDRDQRSEHEHGVHRAHDDRGERSLPATTIATATIATRTPTSATRWARIETRDVRNEQRCPAEQRDKCGPATAKDPTTPAKIATAPSATRSRRPGLESLRERHVAPRGERLIRLVARSVVLYIPVVLGHEGTEGIPIAARGWLG